MSRRRTRFAVLSAHLIGCALWLGVLATTLLIPHPPASVVYALLVPAAIVAVASGGWLAWGLWRFGWVHAKLALAVLVAATAGVNWELHPTGRPALGLRYAAVAALTAATVVAVTKPRRRAQRPRHRPVVTVKESPVGTYALRVLDRAARTALQVFAGYLITAHTIGGVEWRTAVLAAALAVAVAIIQGLVDLPQIHVVGVWGEVVGRAVRTAAQVALGSVAANALLITDVPWLTVISAAGLAALTSVVTSLISIPVGPASVKGTTEVFGPPRATIPPTGALAA